MDKMLYNVQRKSKRSNSLRFLGTRITFLFFRHLTACHIVSLFVLNSLIADDFSFSIDSSLMFLLVLALSLNKDPRCAGEPNMWCCLMFDESTELDTSGQHKFIYVSLMFFWCQTQMFSIYSKKKISLLCCLFASSPWKPTTTTKRQNTHQLWAYSDV